MKKRTGYIFKRGNVYWLRYEIAGRRHSESLHTSSRRKADTEAAKIMAPLTAADKVEALRTIKSNIEAASDTAARLLDERNPPLTIAKGFDAFLESEVRPRKAGEQTLAAYASHWRTFTAWMGENHKAALFLRDVTPEMAAGYIRHLAKLHLSGNRINKQARFLKTLFRVLRKPGRYTENPFDEIARREQIGHTKRPLTIEELKAVIEQSEGELQTLFMLGTFTGLRLADAATLRWDETDLARGIIRRIPSKTRRNGQPVIIGIPGILSEHLAALKRSGPYVLPETAALYQQDCPKLSHKIQAHLVACGIETTKKGKGPRAVVVAGFHSLRHSYISLHAQAGTPQAILQKMAGHGSPMMTEHYTHISEQTARQTALALPPVLGKSAKKNKRRTPAPAWVKELAAGLNADNWQTVRAALLA